MQRGSDFRPLFGAPLAMEGLSWFFLESTFIGLWIFGWVRLSPGLHLASTWLAATGNFIVAYFILVANSFRQNPSGTASTPTPTVSSSPTSGRCSPTRSPSSRSLTPSPPPSSPAVGLCRCVVVSLCRCGGWSATRTWTATRHARQQRLERPSCSSRRPRTPHTATHAYATCGTGYFALTLRAARTSS